MTEAKKDSKEPGVALPTYTLKTPLLVDGKKMESLDLHRLTGRDMLAIEQEVSAMRPGQDYATIGQAERMLRLIGKACGLKYEDVQLMDAADVNGLSDKVSGFLS